MKKREGSVVLKNNIEKADKQKNIVNISKCQWIKAKKYFIFPINACAVIQSKLLCRNEFSGLGGQYE
jgi:hypothetical protein